jgi:3-dehydroquinate dehydratase II
VSSVLVLNGPNLNLLGRRDPKVYGTATLADVEKLCREEGEALGLDVECCHSNHEGELVDAIHGAFAAGQAVVGNFGAYTHTSVAIMDALAVLTTPVVEVHISNIHAREEFRHHSYVSRVADAVIVGAGIHGYALALRHVAHLTQAQA